MSNEDELAILELSNELQSDLLNRICSSVKGNPPTGIKFSLHDLPELVKAKIQEIESLQAKLAMQAEALDAIANDSDHPIYTREGRSSGMSMEAIYEELATTALNATQADVDAFMQGKKMEWEKGVLEEAADYFYRHTDYAPAEGETFERPELILKRMAKERGGEK